MHFEVSRIVLLFVSVFCTVLGEKKCGRQCMDCFRVSISPDFRTGRMEKCLDEYVYTWFWTSG